MSLRNEMIRLAYENPEWRPHILPRIAELDLPDAKVGSMGREARILKGILRQISRVLPTEVKREMASAAKEIQSSGVNSVRNRIQRKITELGRKVGISNLGDAVSRFGQNLSLSKMWGALKTYIRDGAEGLLKMLGFTPTTAKVAAEKNAFVVEALVYIGGSLAILIVVLLTIDMILSNDAPFMDSVYLQSGMETVAWILSVMAGILDDQ